MDSGSTIIPGVTEGCYALVNTNEQYHATRDIVSTSMIKKLLRSAAHLKAAESADKKETASQRLGTAAHAALLEPKLYAARYVVYKGRRQGKEYDKFVEANAGKIILSDAEETAVLGMKNGVLTYREIDLAKAIEIGTAELSIYWTDEETGVKCRIRPDTFSQHGMLDLKSTGDARPEEFIRQAVREGYDIQSAMYSEGMRRYLGELPFYFVAMEDEAPFECWVHQASESMLASGMRKFRESLRLFKECRETGQWPGYRGSFTTLEWPRWAA